jgi:hypothetical protein
MTKADQITIEFINNPEADVHKLAKRYKTAPSYVYKMRARAIQHTNDKLRDSERETAMDTLIETLTTCTPEGDWQVTASTPTSTDVILEERGNRYGKFTDHAAVTQKLKFIMRTHMGPRYDRLAPDQQEALEMIAHKVGRIVNGDPDYHDSWADIAGYAKLVADRLETGKEI